MVGLFRTFFDDFRQNTPRVTDIPPFQPLWVFGPTAPLGWRCAGHARGDSSPLVQSCMHTAPTTVPAAKIATCVESIAQFCGVLKICLRSVHGGDNVDRDNHSKSRKRCNKCKKVVLWAMQPTPRNPQDGSTPLIIAKPFAEPITNLIVQPMLKTTPHARHKELVLSPLQD